MEISNITRPDATGPLAVPVTPEDQNLSHAVISAIKAVNQTELMGEGTELMFARDRATNRPVVRIVDKDTREVLDQIPPEVVLVLAESLKNA